MLFRSIAPFPHKGHGCPAAIVGVETVSGFSAFFFGAAFLIPTGKAKAVTYNVVGSASAKWALSAEDIKANAGDYNALSSIYNCMSSKLTKELYPKQLAGEEGASELVADMLERRDLVSSLMREAKAKGNAQKTPQVTLSTELAEKVKSGKALKKAEQEELTAALAALGINLG